MTPVVVVVALLALSGVAWLLLTFGRMLWIGIVQWRDALSLDRWTEVMSTIGRNKLRTFLTMISVAWGIFVLVALLGLGTGLDQGARKSFARDAANGVWINQNKTSIPYKGYDIGRWIGFENEDYEAAKKVPGVEFASAQHWLRGFRWGQQLTRYGGKASTFSIEAVHPATLRMQAHDMAAGRFLSESDITELRKTAVIGATVMQFLFEPGDNPIGKWITVGGIAFQVVGVFSDSKGAEEERRVYVPISTAQLAFNGGERIGQIQLMLGDADAEEARKIIDTIVGQLAQKHDFDPTDKQAVRVHNNIENAERFTKMFWMISTFVLLVGLGTLAAGVVGVSNIMMIAVKERTKEIGVRKALGATPNSIIFMILQEAVFLTGVAGMLGLAAGVGFLEILPSLMDTEMLDEPRISFVTGVGATLFLVLAGAFAGFFPARAAARVNPIHALRDQ
ncbi:MAG: ABC transporter permease [Kofleriaceae bacterium]